jgi:hypothetical protein
MNPLPWIVGAPFVIAFAAAAWKGWRGGLAVGAAAVALSCGLFGLTVMAQHPPTPGGDYGRGQSWVYAGSFLVFALAAVAAGALAGLIARRLALRGRRPMLEVEGKLQERGSKR